MMKAQQTPNPETDFKRNLEISFLINYLFLPAAQLPSAVPPAVAQSATDLHWPDIELSDIRGQASCLNV